MASVFWNRERRYWVACYRDFRGVRTTKALKHLAKNQKRTAARAADEIERAAAIRGPAISIGTAAEYWIGDKRANNTIRTYERYRTVLNVFMAKIAPENTSLAKIGQQHVRRFRDLRLEAGYAKSTVRNDMKCLRAFFSWCRKQRDPETRKRWIEENPCEDVSVPRPEYALKYFPTGAQVLAMLGDLGRDRGLDRVMMGLAILGAFGGFRRCEVIRLKWEQVDFENRLIYVFGKSKFPRPVPMHKRVEQFLLDLPQHGERVFPSPYAETGDLRSPFAARLFNRWLKDHGYPFTHHALRRYFNDSLRRCTGLSDSARRLVVGHEDEITNRLYQNPQASEARPFIEALGQ